MAVKPDQVEVGKIYRSKSGRTWRVEEKNGNDLVVSEITDGRVLLPFDVTVRRFCSRLVSMTRKQVVVLTAKVAESVASGKAGIAPRNDRHVRRLQELKQRNSEIS